MHAYDESANKGPLLVMGNAFGSQAFVQEAKKLGLRVIASDGASVDVCRAKQQADEYWDIECGDLGALEKACRANNVIGIVSGASNFVIERAAELCDRLGLNACYSGPGRAYETDKALFKALCREKGVAVPKDYAMVEERNALNLPDIEFPVVVKPTDRAGNVGVGYCYDAEDLQRGYSEAFKESYSGNVVIEEMMLGDEWFSYYAVGGGKAKLISLCAMLAEPGYPKNVYSITTTLTSAVQRYIDEIDEPIKEMLTAAGCSDGIAWVQVMTDGSGRFRAIEMGYRIDGTVMIEPMRQLSTFDAFKWMIEYATGKSHQEKDLEGLTPTEGNGFATSYMLWVDRDCTIGEIEGLDRLEGDARLYIDCVKSPGEDARQYSPVGLVAFAAKDAQETIEIIEKVNNTVRIIDDEGNDVLIRFTDFAQLEK